MADAARRFAASSRKICVPFIKRRRVHPLSFESKPLGKLLQRQSLLFPAPRQKLLNGPVHIDSAEPHALDRPLQLRGRDLLIDTVVTHISGGRRRAVEGLVFGQANHSIESMNIEASLYQGCVKKIGQTYTKSSIESTKIEANFCFRTASSSLPVRGVACCHAAVRFEAACATSMPGFRV
jgi:hypothetical protein